jgi:feruloyl esterase
MARIRHDTASDIHSIGIKYEDLAYGSLNGFATVGSNNGKNGTSGLAFFGNTETVIDFAWRS